MRKSKRKSLWRYLTNVDWSTVKTQNDCDSKLAHFEELVKIGMDKIMPEKQVSIYSKDAPCMSIKLKKLISQRQTAFNSNGKSSQYKVLRNAVSRERKSCKTKYYTSKVQDLKDANPNQWWKEVKKLSGSTKKEHCDLLNNLLVPEFEAMSREEIANAINLAFLEPLQLFQSLDPSTAYLTCDDEAETMEVPTHRVYYSLLRLHKNKTPGPDGHPNWLFKEFAEILSDPVTDILNTSFKEQKVPTGWKLASITPLPKVKHVHYPQKELRPISLTPALSKIAEDFVVTDYIINQA